MKYVNKYGLPEAFVRAVVNDPYTPGEKADFSTTGLQTPARAAALIREHKDKLEVDVSTRVASIIGQGSHSVAERAARPDLDICEKRFYADFNVDGKVYKLSGQVDLYEKDTKTLLDWKTTKAYAFSKKAGSGKKPEWIAQANVNALLMGRNGYEVKSLQIIAMLKDWDKREAARGNGYPASEVVAVDLPMWSENITLGYIYSRIQALVAARESLPMCTAQETWGGNRCGQWCDAASVCSQYQEALKTGLLTKAAE